MTHSSLRTFLAAPAPRQLSPESPASFDLAASLSPCPSWCDGRRVDFDSCGGEHRGPATEIPATAGDYALTDDGCVFPMVDVSAGTHADGRVQVTLTVHDPAQRGERIGTWADADLTPVQARRLAVVLLAIADAAETR